MSRWNENVTRQTIRASRCQSAPTARKTGEPDAPANSSTVAVGPTASCTALKSAAPLAPGRLRLALLENLSCECESTEC